MGWSEQTSGEQPPTNLKPDEEILFFPTYGTCDPQTGVWKLEVHGKVFEPENDSKKRALLMALLRRFVDVGNQPLMEERVRPFLVDNERGKSVTIDFDGEQYSAGTSGPNGHFSHSFAMSADSLFGASDQQVRTNNRVRNIKAVLPNGDQRAYAGQIHLIAPEGVSVISDIDDTIKHSQVTDKPQLIKNTFLRPFREINGMPRLYADLAEAGVAFHYVSSSPWQLYGPLNKFMVEFNYPMGTMHLKFFRLTDRSALRMIRSQQKTKLAAIRPLLDAFPNRRFMLIGDSGERDPEIYGEIASEHPEQVAGIFIRNVTGQGRAHPRYTEAFGALQSDRWTLFEDPTQVYDRMLEIAQTVQH